MRIAFFETRDREKEVLTGLLSGHTVDFFSEKLSIDTAGNAAGADVVSVFVDSLVTGEVLAMLPELKLIATRSTGFDHIDLAAAKERGVAVASVPAYGSRTVAEFAFGLILSLSRRIPEASGRVRRDMSYSLDGLRGFDLAGKTIGIIGTGKIGKNMARMASGFDMRLLGSDPFPDVSFAESLNLEYVPLDILLSQSDVITLHAPYIPSTRYLINAGNIGLIKKGAILINTSRGELVDAAALVSSLTSGAIAGAALDVIEGERMLKEEKELIAGGKVAEGESRLVALNHMLISMPNVIVTPHIAFYSKEAEDEILRTTASNIAAFADGMPQNIVSA